MSPKAFRIGVVLLALITGGLYLFGGPPSWPRVSVALVRTGDLEQSFSATGQVCARRVSLNSPSTGRVEQAGVRSGDKVTRGQVLAVVDDAPAWDRLAGAQADFWTAQSQLNVAAARWKENHTAVLEEELNGARKVTAIRSQALERARAGVNRGTVRSPVEGSVLMARVQAGDYVGAGQPILELMDDSRVWVEALVAEADAELIKQGLAVTVKSHAQAAYAGVVSRVPASLEDPPEMPGNARYLRVEVDLGEGQRRPLVGSSVEVSGSTVLAKGVRMIPREALVHTPQGDFCVVLSGSRAHRTALKLGQQSAAWLEILEGPEPGTPVVTEEPASLAEGQAVRAR